MGIRLLTQFGGLHPQNESGNPLLVVGDDHLNYG